MLQKHPGRDETDRTMQSVMIVTAAIPLDHDNGPERKRTQSQTLPRASLRAQIGTRLLRASSDTRASLFASPVHGPSCSFTQGPAVLVP